MVKSRYSTLDLAAAIGELESLKGMRVANIYDVDQKTYLLKLAKGDNKAMLLIESGTRIHKTDYAWPKSMMPSGFSMKMRKHIRTRRIESIRQLGVDRVLDLEFGSGELCTHLIIELYARGNIILTDGEYRILSLLRSRTHQMTANGEGEGGKSEGGDNSDVRIAVGEIYPFQLTKAEYDERSLEGLRECFSNAAPNDNVKKALLGYYGDMGPALLEHCVRLANVDPLSKISAFDITEGSAVLTNLFTSLESAKTIVSEVANNPGKGYIIQKAEQRAIVSHGGDNTLLVYDEFHPILFKQHEDKPHLTFDTFNQTVDEFFSQLESQKLDVRAVQQQKAAMKKMENIHKDHERRLQVLQDEQGQGEHSAYLLENNTDLVDAAIKAINSLIATGMDWDQVKAMVQEAQSMNDPVAVHISALKLERNAIVLGLRDPYAYDDEYDSDDENGEPKQSRPIQVEVDLALGAHGNARKYHDRKKQARTKEQKTRDVSKQALKTVEKATKKTMKEVEIRAQITKARKTLWFEKFLWFISSDNFLVIAGRDAQQNELIVKRHFRKGDIYVHADIHGAATCIIKNSNADQLPPPRTLGEAGVMAICHSAAWEAKIVISAYWVHHHQVSKTAPTGEYLTTGSFMIRGKKNFLPPAPLVLGYGVLFRVEDSCIANHLHERRPLLGDGEEQVVASAREYEERSHKIQQRQRPVRMDSEASPVKDDDDATEEHESAPDAEGDEGSSPSENEQDGAAHGDLEENKADSTSSSEDEDDAVQFPETHVGSSYLGSIMGMTGAADDLSDSDSGNEPDSAQASETRRAYITAKQRREMKKKKPSGESDDGDLNDEDYGSEPPVKAKQDAAPPKPKAQPPPPPAPRGKKGKLKKIKEKYADQDEEERQLRMEILQSAGTGITGGKKGTEQSKKGAGTKAKARETAIKDKESSQPALKPPPSAFVKQSLDDVKDDWTTDNGEQSTQDSADRNSVLAARQARKAEKTKEAEEMRQLMEEEHILDDDEKDNLTILDALTGCPRSDDLLIFAMAYCAPYATMQTFKYKVKLQPGAQKKGKASKQAVELFSRNSDVTLEKDLIRAIPDPELIQQMPSKVKLSAPNLHSHTKKK